MTVCDIVSAIKNDDLAEYRKLIEQDYDPSAGLIISPDFFPPILGSNANSFHSAVFFGSMSVVSNIMIESPDINLSTDRIGRNSIHFAAASKSIEMFHLIEQNTKNLFIQDQLGKTVMHYAAEFGSLAIFSYLWTLNGNINQEDRERLRPIHYACLNGCHEVLSFILSTSTVDEVVQSTPVPWYLISHRKNEQIFAVFVNNGFDITHLTDNHGITILNKWIIEGRHDMVQCLLPYINDLYYRDETGFTPIENAARTFNKRVIQAIEKRESELYD